MTTRLPPVGVARSSVKLDVTPVATPVVRQTARECVEPAAAPLVALNAAPHRVAPQTTKGLTGVVEFFEGTHRAEGQRTPRDERYHLETRVRVPKLADFAIDGLSKLEAAGLTPNFDRDVTIRRPNGTVSTLNLMRAANDSVPVDDFYLALEEVLRTTTFELDLPHASALGLSMPAGASTMPLSGAAVLAVIDDTIAEATRLSELPQPEAAPIPNETPAVRQHFLTMLRRFAIQAVFHSRDLTSVHVAMGHDVKKDKPLDETLRHDLVESAPLKDLAWQLERRPHDAWMDAWLRAEVKRQAPHLLDGVTDAKSLYALVQRHAELTFNCSALNPHNVVSMFRWGDSREDCNVLIDPHRLSPHHNGSSTNDIDFQQRAINFLSHHMPREHMGVRHEQRGEWDLTSSNGTVVPFGKLERAFLTDHAISGSTVLQAIAREGAKFYRAAEEKGFTVPWQKLKVPGTVEFVQLDSAYQTLQSTNRVADDLYAAQLGLARESLSKATLATASLATSLIDRLEHLTVDSPRHVLEDTLARFSTLAAQGGEAADRPLVSAIGLAAVARLTQLSPSSVETVERFIPFAERLEDAVYRFDSSLAPKEGRLFVGLDTARQLRAQLDHLPAAAAEAKAANDGSTALVYENWSRLVSKGFISLAH